MFLLKLELIQQLLVIGMALSTVTCAIIQKVKCLFKTNKYICFYSFVINMFFGILFCISFTTVQFPISLWVGLFSFLGADTIYKALEGKISSHADLVVSRTISVKEENLINTDGDN